MLRFLICNVMLSQNIMKSTVTVKLSFVTLNKIWIGYTHCKILNLLEWFLLFPFTFDTLSKVIKSIFILTIDNTQGGLLVTQLKVKVFSLGWEIKSHWSQQWYAAQNIPFARYLFGHEPYFFIWASHCLAIKFMLGVA